MRPALITRSRFARTAALGALALLLSACGAGGSGAGSSSPASEAGGAGATANDVATLVAAPDVLLLDVRRPDEFAAGHVDGAVNIPLGETARMVDAIGAKDRPVVLHCRTGNRSGKALNELRAAGFTRLANGGSFQETATAAGRSVVR
jgi:phage shock protein E